MGESVQVRTLAHGRPKTLLVILIGGFFALIGGLRLVSLWSLQQRQHGLAARALRPSEAER